jgi:protein SCO1
MNMLMERSRRFGRRQTECVRVRWYRQATPVVLMLMLMMCEGFGQGWSTTAAAQAKAHASRATEQSAAAAYFTDVVLINQYGKEMRFYSDLIKGRTVIVIPFFTSCTGACPVMNRNLAKIQSWLGNRLGRDAYIISLSVDPSRDTVERLRAYAEKVDARPGWFFLSGTRENVDVALTKLGQRVEQPEAHTNLMIIGNDVTGLWKKAFGLADSAALIRIVESVIDDKGDGAG